MKKKNVKTYVLVFLILSSMFLTGRIWFDEKLWPEGYNFFSIIEDKFSWSGGKIASSLTKETISFPKNLIVNNVGKRSVYSADSDSFGTIIPDIKEIIKVSLENSDMTDVTQDEWTMALKNRSVHVIYPVAYDSRLFLNILGSYKTDSSSIPVKEFIISSGDSLSPNVTVFIKNSYTGEVKKSYVKWDKQRFEDLIKLYAVDSIGDLSYSSELNFDKTNADDTSGVQQKVYIDPAVPIQLNKKLTGVVKDINPLYDNEFNIDTVNTLLKQFDYNTSGAKKYTERDNSIVFVENYSTLKLHPNGLIEFKSVDASKGIPLEATDFYGSLLACVDFVNLMWNDVFPSVPLNINISSDVIDTKSKGFTLTMDYFADGTQIVIDLPQTSSHAPANHGVEIEVYDGKIVSYKQVLSFFESAEKSVNAVSAIDALDSLFAGQSGTGKVIKDLYPVYILSDPPYRKSAWAVRTETDETVIIN